MNKLFLVLCWLTIISTFSLGGCVSEKESEIDQVKEPIEVIEMKLGHYAAKDHPGNIAAQKFAEAVESRTNGSIKVTVFPDNQLGSPPEMLEQNIVGAIDMSLPTQGALDKYSKKFSTVMIPFAFKDYEHAYKVLDGPFKEWVEGDLEKQGLIFLSNWEYGFRNITNNLRPINRPEDVEGMRLRTPPEIQLQSAMEALGANVTKIAFPETYMSLKQGVVDGQENPVAVIYHNNLYEVQPYLALTQHVYNSMVHIISKEVWDQLTKEQQTIIREESIKAGNWMREEMQKQEAEIIIKLEEEGMEITYPDRELFKAKMQYANDVISVYAGKENVETFLEMVEETN
ncbi:TRAP transporter substrate-binding protein [Vallitalea okinawensis]|uniref:TRAP transporter substrate-binding protein n=1 Tax=Vallitalea okinawensis TaxID=2078660 RepID=UPI000CFB0D4F|nr:TRAP transporter substrate-binding protein [Vallitalea okinawensis]